MPNEAAKKALNVLADLERAPADTPAPDAKSKALQALDELDAQPSQPSSVANRGTGITTDPLPIEQTRPINQSMATEAEALGIPTTAGPTELEQRAAAAGVLYDKPAKAGHALASLAWSDEDRRYAFQEALSAEYGRPVPVEIGPGTGALEYLDPDTGRFALVEPPNKGLLADIAGAAGGSIVMVPELAGGALWGLSHKSPSMAWAGGAVGAFAGELSRLGLGMALGINRDMTPNDAYVSALRAAGLSAATGAAAEKGLQFAQFMINAFRGDAVKYAAKAGERLGVSLEEAADLQDQINRVVAAERMRIGARNADLPPALRTQEPENRRFALTLGEATGDADLLAFEDAMKRNSRYQARFGEFDEERQQAARQFYETIAKPFTPGSMDATTTFEAVQQMARTRLKYEQDRATEPLQRYEADASNALNDVERFPMYQIGDVARNVGDVEYGAFVQRADALAGNIRTMAGGAKFIANTNAAEAWGQLSDRARNIIIPALKRDAKKRQMISPKTHVNEEGEAVLNRLYDPEAKLSFAQSWDTISRLKEVLREGGGADMDVGAMKKIVSAMEKDLYESANQTELGPMYRDFVSWYRREKQRLNEGVVGKILQRDGGPGGRFTFASEEVFRTVFPASGPRGGYGLTATREFMDLIKNDPQAISAFRGAIADDWRNYVVRDGRVDRARHAEWLANHSEQLRLTFSGVAPEERRALGGLGLRQPTNAGEPLFTAEEMRQIGRAEGFERMLQAREARTKEVLDGLNKSFNAKLTSLENPGALLQLVRGDLDGYKARDLVKLLGKTPDVRRSFQAHYLRDMRERVMTARHPTSMESIVSARGLRTFLYGKADGSDKGQLNVVKAMFGDRYAGDLMTLERALSAAARETTFPNRSNTSGWSEVGKLLVRAKFGVISKEARVFTSLAMLNRATADRMLAKATMNPGDLRRLMSIWRSDIRNRKTLAVLGQLGFGPGELTPDE